MFRETFNPYRPSIIEWPLLSPEAQARLTALPIWDIAVQTEGKARLRMLAYGRSLADPAWRDAIERNAWEENRHKEVLSSLVAAYGIELAPEPVYRNAWTVSLPSAFSRWRSGRVSSRRSWSTRSSR
jgi:hypothetical protein